MLLLTVLAALLGALVGVARRGSFERLAQTPIRLWWLALAAWLLEAVLFTSPLAPLLQPATTLLLGAAMVAIGVVLVANLRLPGLALFAAGLLLNAVVMAANGGAMPVSEAALRTAGNTAFLDELRAQERVQKSTLMQPGAPLWPLADVVPVPGAAKVYSPGDLVAALGVLVLVVGRMGSRRGGRPSVEPTALDEPPAATASTAAEVSPRG